MDSWRDEGRGWSFLRARKLVQRVLDGELTALESVTYMHLKKKAFISLSRVSGKKEPRETERDGRK